MAKTTDNVWIIGATYFNEEALADLDSRFCATESYRERLQQLIRLCKGEANPLSQFTVALGIAASTEAAISFYNHVQRLCKYNLKTSFFLIGTLDHWWWNVKRQPNNETSKQIRDILAAFPYAG